MIVKAIDKTLNITLIGDINPIKKKINLYTDTKKIDTTIYSIPSTKITFRKYSFPTDKHLDKAVKTHLSLDLPIDLEKIEYRYITKKRNNKVDVFCVIVKKEDLNNFPKKSVVDTEIFALLRLAIFNNINDGIIYHFTNSYILKIVFKDNFPEEIRVLEELEKVEEEAYISGIIGDYRKNILNNPTGNPKNNVVYGLLLKWIYNLGVNLLKEDNIDFIKNSLKGLVYLTLTLILLNSVFFVNLVVKSKELKKIKEKEKEILVKYWNLKGKIYSPLTQAKGIIKSLHMKKSKNMLDAVSLLEKLGKAVSISKVENINSVSIYKSKLIVEGLAKDENQFKEFKNQLKQNFKIQSEETLKDEKENKLKFKIEAYYE